MQPPLFHRVVGEALSDLSPPVVAIHDVGDGKTWHGAATVEVGRSLLARLVSAVVGFPPTATSVPLTVEMAPYGDGERWVRKYGDAPLVSYIIPGPTPGMIEETMSGVTVCLRLDTEDGGLRHVPTGVRLFGVPLPRVLWPTLDVREDADGELYRYSVAMHLWGMLLVCYAGNLETQEHHDV
ncbi:MAG: DUF4166 domain-containing protein [Pseudomonadota bacterium]